MKLNIILFMLFNFSMFSQAQEYLNLQLSDNSFLTIELSELDKITFDGGNVLFTLTNAQVYTVPMSDVSTFGASSTSNGGSPLPVELISFSAEVNGINVVLKWITSTEVNNYGFEIQRSVVGTNRDLSLQWETLGFIEGNGNSNSPKEYSFIDESAQNGTYSYRLKQIDFDGKYEYSDIVEVVVNNLPTEFALEQNYPNPFNPSTVIRYELPKKGFTSLKVYDVTGREVSSLVNEVKDAGRYSIIFNASGLCSGLYICRIISSDFSYSIKLLLVK